jgi:hypothetical protein
VQEGNSAIVLQLDYCFFLLRGLFRLLCSMLNSAVSRCDFLNRLLFDDTGGAGVGTPVPKGAKATRHTKRQ